MTKIKFALAVMAVALAAGAWLSKGWGAPGPAADAAADTTIILGPQSVWHWHLTWESPLVRRSSGELQFAGFDKLWGYTKLAEVKIEKKSTEPPPGNWTAWDFDDSAWPRARGPLYENGRSQHVASIAARGRFEVPDPTKAGDLVFGLDYYGGVIVYLNGEELSRQNLPKEALQWDTPADDYPPEAYVAPDGSNLNWVGFGDPEKYKDRFALRDRHCEIKIAAAKLRQGVNVIAVNLHRAPMSEVLLKGKFKHEPIYGLWSQMGWFSCTLKQAAGGAVIPNVTRPRGIQIWTESILPGLRTAFYADPGQTLRPVVIRGTRNGAFSGQIVVGSSEVIKKLSVAVSDMKQEKDQTCVMPASCVQVRYALGGLVGEKQRQSCEQDTVISKWPRFDGLEEVTPAEVPVSADAGGAMQPIVFTVRIPQDAKSGDYVGVATVSAEGLKPVEVTLRVSVAGWALPDPKDYGTVMGFIQSPESLALQYKVDMWSESHWKLIDRSFALLGQIAAKDVYIPIRTRTYFGNEYSMVRWIKQKDGSWQHDFSIIEKYLDIVVKRLGKVPAVVIYAWDVDDGASYMGGGSRMEKKPYGFTVVDPATGKLENQEGPKWGDPEMRPFLQPVFDGLRKILAVRGMEKSIMVGLCGDRIPDKEVTADLVAVAPEAPWVIASHTVPNPRKGEKEPGWHTVVWESRPAPDPSEKRVYGWKNPSLKMAHPRYCSPMLGMELGLQSSLTNYRGAPEMVLTALNELRGIARCGADFWPVISDKKGVMSYAVGRYPDTNKWHGGDLIEESYPYVLAPGRDGAIATLRYEMLREGIEDTEARIFLERILDDPARKKLLGDELACRCQDLLDQRVRMNLWAIRGAGNYLSWIGYAGSGIEMRSAQLFNMAGEVAEKLKLK